MSEWMMYTAIIQTTRAHHNIFTAEPEGDDIKFFSVLIICKYAVSLCVCSVEYEFVFVYH